MLDFIWNKRFEKAGLLVRQIEAKITKYMDVTSKNSSIYKTRANEDWD